MNHYIQGGQQLWRSRQGASQQGAREREKEKAARKKGEEANTEKWEKKVQNLKGKIQAKNLGVH